jgi:hypothetical protein
LGNHRVVDQVENNLLRITTTIIIIIIIIPINITRRTFNCIYKSKQQ